MTDVIEDVRGFEVHTAEGKPVLLETLLKPVTLIVNIDCKIGAAANSECAELQEMYLRLFDKGFEILAFPSDQFQFLTDQGQHVTALDVQDDLSKRYNVTFPIMHKVNVNGENADPLFLYLQKTLSGFPTDAIKWDFTKFLIVDGVPVKRYAPTTSPLSIEDEILDEMDSIPIVALDPTRTGATVPTPELTRDTGFGLPPSSSPSRGDTVDTTAATISTPPTPTPSLQSSQPQEGVGLFGSSGLGNPLSSGQVQLERSGPVTEEYVVRDPETGIEARVITSESSVVGTLPPSATADGTEQSFVQVTTTETRVLTMPGSVATSLSDSDLASGLSQHKRTRDVKSDEDSSRMSKAADLTRAGVASRVDSAGMREDVDDIPNRGVGNDS